jgi:PAS domain S-box-containing protein
MVKSILQRTLQARDCDDGATRMGWMELLTEEQMQSASPDSLFRRVIEHAPMSMAIVGPDGTIEYINPKAIETFGYLPEDIPTMARWWEQAYPDEQYRAEISARWMGLMAQAFAEESEIPRSDYLVTCKDGTVKTVGIFGVPVAGKVFVMFDDITERQQTEQRLRKSEANFRTVLESSLDVAYRRDLKRDQYDYLSPSIETISGLTVAEFSEMSFAALQDHFHPDDRPPLQERVRRSLAGEPIKGTFEYRFRHKDGSYHWFSDCSTVVSDAAGTPLYHVGIVRDVTERKRIEEELGKRQQEFQALVENAPDAIFIQTRGCFAYVNAAMVRLLGAQTPEQLVGRSILEIIQPDDRALVAERIRHINEAREQKPATAVKYVRRDGGLMDVEVSAVPFVYRQEQGALVFARDVTKRKRIEAELHQRQQEFQSLVENAPDVIARFDRQFRHLYINKANILRNQPEQIIGKTLGELGWPAELCRQWEAAFEEAFVTKREVFCEYAAPLGPNAFLQTRVMPETNAEGKVETVLVVARDITSLKKLEAASRANERRLTALLNASTEPIMLLDPQGMILTLNQAMAQRIGKPPAELLGAFAPGLLDQDLGQARQAHLKRVVDSGQTLRFEDEKNGGCFDNNLYPVVDEGGRVVAVAVYSSDITARKQAELKLQQANVALESKVQKRTEQLRVLASELTLAEQRERKRIAGILHDDLQQLLIAARFNLGGLLQSKQKQTQQLVAQVDGLIAQSVQRSRLLSVELSPPILQIGGLVPALEWLTSWMETNHGLSVAFSSLGRGAPQQEDMAAVLFQVTRELLLNVVKHARVKAATIEITQDPRTFRIVVADQGVGFDPTHLAARPANATGFGLLGIRDRLDLLGGRMEIESAPGKGSRFTLMAPCAQAKAARPKVRAVRKAKKGPGPAEPLRTGADGTGPAQKIRLLIVDDHNVVRQAFAQLLNGTDEIQVVGEAASGKEALALLEKLPVEIVTMDINMKGMDGIEATRRIRARYPQIRVLGLSMFEEEERAKAMRAAGACDYLSKSSPAANLIAAIRRAALTQVTP